MARASLAAVLLSRYDILLLDEPTNDLDLDGLARLEAFVLGRRGGLAVVSHDREFLSRTITEVIELDPFNELTRQFAGGWEAFLDEREVARRHLREQFDDYADKRGELRDRMQAAREQSVRGALRAKRKAPDNDRAARGARIEAATSGAAKVRSLETRLTRLDAEAVAEPRKEWELRIELPSAARSGDMVATLTDAVVERGDFTLGPVTLDIRWADRVAVLGPNGGGKTTLLQALLGQLPLTSGSSALGPGVVVGELDQVRRVFGGDQNVVDVLTAATTLVPEEARTLLAKFGLKAAHVERPAGSLSPGERTRAGLALLMARQTNCLVLDEPTNHLDLPAIEQLEQAVAAYSGTLLLVSHDRRLLEAVPTQRQLHVARGQVTEDGRSVTVLHLPGEEPSRISGAYRRRRGQDRVSVAMAAAPCARAGAHRRAEPARPLAVGRVGVAARWTPEPALCLSVVGDGGDGRLRLVAAVARRRIWPPARAGRPRTCGAVVRAKRSGSSRELGEADAFASLTAQTADDRDPDPELAEYNDYLSR